MPVDTVPANVLRTRKLCCTVRNSVVLCGTLLGTMPMTVVRLGKLLCIMDEIVSTGCL